MLTSDRVRSVYAEQIAALTSVERLQLLTLLAEAVARDAMLAAEPRKHSVMEFHGAGRANPVGMDAQEYINRLRGGWDDQP